jgi:hypothetical protein
MRDPNELKRTANKIAWYPGNENKIGVAYSIMNFQDKRFSAERLSPDSYIWYVLFLYKNQLFFFCALMF